MQSEKSLLWETRIRQMTTSGARKVLPIDRSSGYRVFALM